jgi:hypothetical protein
MNSQSEDDEIKGKKDDFFARPFIDIDGNRIPIQYIFGYKPIDVVDKGEWKYGVKINPYEGSSEMSPRFSNLCIFREDKVERDELLEYIDEILIESKTVKIFR